MNSAKPVLCLLAVFSTALLPSCLMRQTVSENGEVISSDYVVKRPIKDLIDNTENTP